jgi:hypothetical protein
MPTVDENKEQWGSRFDWSQSGDDWSDDWGGTENLWWTTVYPRIRSYLPAPHILEIAPGFGRMTQFLHTHCDRLTIVDLNENCVAACRRRFAGVPKISYHVNDGRSLPAVNDASVDFAFTFDSLVHADADVIEAYLDELATKLTADGVAFFHHSNAGSYLQPLKATAGRLHADALAVALSRRINRNWRAEDMSLNRFDALCRHAGLHCISQETIRWNSRFFNDCFSTVTRPGSRWDRPKVVSKNSAFGAEVRRSGELARLYGPGRAVERE